MAFPLYTPDVTVPLPLVRQHGCVGTRSWPKINFRDERGGRNKVLYGAFAPFQMCLVTFVRATSALVTRATILLEIIFRSEKLFRCAPNGDRSLSLQINTSLPPPPPSWAIFERPEASHPYSSPPSSTASPSPSAPSPLPAAAAAAFACSSSFNFRLTSASSAAASA